MKGKAGARVAVAEHDGRSLQCVQSASNATPMEEKGAAGVWDDCVIGSTFR